MIWRVKYYKKWKKKIIELLPLNLVVVGDLFFSPNLRYELPQVSSFKMPNEIFILTLLLKLCKSMWFLNYKEILRKKGSLFHCILCYRDNIPNTKLENMRHPMMFIFRFHLVQQI